MDLGTYATRKASREGVTLRVQMRRSVEVNIKSILQLSKRPIVEQHKTRLLHLQRLTDEVINYYADAILHSDASYEYEEIQQLRNVASLTSTDTVWPKQLPTFNIGLLEKTKFYTRKELEDVYYKWPKYLERVHYDKLYGTALAQSDSCLSALAQNPVNHHAKLVLCHLPYNCVELVHNTVDYGFTMPRRILFLLMAQFGRGCYIVSPEEDKALKESLAARMYNEAEYIAQHGFKLPELMIEIVGIGSIDGHSQFLRRTWLEELIEFQTDNGCFNLTRQNDVNPEDTINSRDGYQFGLNYHPDRSHIVEDSCQSHMTAVGSIMLSSAVRFITEMEKKTKVMNISLTLPPLDPKYKTTPKWG